MRCHWGNYDGNFRDIRLFKMDDLDHGALGPHLVSAVAVLLQVN